MVLSEKFSQKHLLVEHCPIPTVTGLASYLFLQVKLAISGLVSSVFDSVL